MKAIPVLSFVTLAAPVFAQYAGPAILARGEAPAAMAAPQVDFRPYVMVSAAYDTGLAGVAVNDHGQLASGSSIGGSLSWGVSGVHSWRHTRVGLEYNGGVLYYAEQNQFSNVDQSFMLGITHQLSRHTQIIFNETAGLTTRNFGQLGLRETVPFDPATTFVPVTDYFDNRTIYLTTQASFQIQTSARLSFALSGGDFFVDRRSKALYGTRGDSASGDVQYRMTRRSTIGAEYEYLHFSYPGLFGGTDAHGVAASYATRLSRFWEFSSYGGFMRVESTFTQTVPVDPVIAALLGIQGAPQIVHQILTVPNLGARISRTFRTGVLYGYAGHSIIPGNGLFLTSIATQVSVGYSYTGLRNWSFGTAASYDRASAMGTITGVYGDRSAQLLLSRLLLRHISFVLSYAARQYTSPSYSNYNRTIQEGRVGFGYSPGDIPVRIW